MKCVLLINFLPKVPRRRDFWYTYGMNDLSYDVPLVKQGVSECLPASATQLMNFFGIDTTFDEVKKGVPLYVTSAGKPVGTSVGHMGSYLLRKGFSVTFHTVDIELFDPSWSGMSSEDMIGKLKDRRKYLKHARYNDEILDVIVDGYVKFLEEGGNIYFSIIDEKFLLEKLKEGPFILQVSYNFLNNCPKYFYNFEKNQYEQDPIQGHPTTHAVVVSGYKSGKFVIVDPDFEFGGVREIDSGRLIGAFYLAETDFDPILITLSK